MATVVSALVRRQESINRFETIRNDYRQYDSATILSKSIGSKTELRSIANGKSLFRTKQRKTRQKFASEIIIVSSSGRIELFSVSINFQYHYYLEKHNNYQSCRTHGNYRVSTMGKRKSLVQDRCETGGPFVVEGEEGALKIDVAQIAFLIIACSIH